jgi:hypothetical protein
MLSTAEWRRTEEVIRAALKRGADPSEDLDRLNMLATQRRIKSIEASALTKFAEQLEAWRPDEILRKISPGPWTPTETIMAIHQFLKEYIDAVKD